LYITDNIRANTAALPFPYMWYCYIKLWLRHDAKDKTLSRTAQGEMLLKMTLSLEVTVNNDILNHIAAST